MKLLTGAVALLVLASVSYAQSETPKPPEGTKPPPKALNPQPEPPGTTASSDANRTTKPGMDKALNPQPEPPGAHGNADADPALARPGRSKPNQLVIPKPQAERGAQGQNPPPPPPGTKPGEKPKP